MYSKLGGAALGGVLVALSLPPWGWWPLAFAGLAVLSLLLRGQPVWRRSRTGFAFGVGMFTVGLWWMGEFNAAGAGLAILVEAIFMGLAGVACPPGRSRTFGFPAALVVAEALRRVVPFGGLPLAGIALGQVGGPLAGAARLGGELLLVALVGICGAAVAELVRPDRRDQDGEPADGNQPTAREQGGEAADPVPPDERAPVGEVAEPGRSNGRSPGMPIKLVPHHWPRPGVAIALVAGFAIAGASAPDGSAGESVAVAAVQGGGPRGFRGVDADTEVVFGAQVAASERIRPPLDLVLWPEDVIDVDRPIGTTAQAEAVGAIAKQVGAPVVAGVVEDAGADRFRNAAVVWSAAGAITDRYDKVHRVPFGEYVPLRGLVDRVADLSVIPRDAIAGRGAGVVSTSAGEMGVLISYEVFFADRARAATAAGGRALLVPTNAASFSTTQVPTQEVAAARLRAIESGRAVVQAAPTGYSVFIDHRGRVLAQHPRPAPGHPAPRDTPHGPHDLPPHRRLARACPGDRASCRRVVGSASREGLDADHELASSSLDNLLIMKKVQISKGGQISIPASIRRRWQSTDLVIEDRGDEIVLRPLPPDPLAAARGSLRSAHSVEADRRALRSEEASRKR